MKPLDCVGIEADIGKTITGKNDFRPHPDRPLSGADILFMAMMTEITGCHFIDVTPDKPTK